MDVNAFYSSIDIITGFFISLVIAYLLTPYVRVLAKRVGLLDRPTSAKVHRRATPLLGGLAIFAAYFIAVIFTVGINRVVASLLIGGMILLVVGIVDDRYGMMPKVKLFGQALNAFHYDKSEGGVGVVHIIEILLYLFKKLDDKPRLLLPGWKAENISCYSLLEAMDILLLGSIISKI